MSIGRVFRWVGAVLDAVIVFVVIAAIGALIWQKFHGGPLGTMGWTLTAATCGGVLAGTLILPRENWKMATLGLGFLALLLPLILLIRNAIYGSNLGLIVTELGAVLLGVIIAYFSVRIGAVARRSADLTK